MDDDKKRKRWIIIGIMLVILIWLWARRNNTTIVGSRDGDGGGLNYQGGNTNLIIEGSGGSVFNNPFYAPFFYTSPGINITNPGFGGGGADGNVNLQFNGLSDHYIPMFGLIGVTAV